MSNFGTPNYGGNKQNFKKKVYFNIKDGDNFYRILPPFGELKEKGVWSRFYEVVFGYKNMEGKLRTFLSTQVKNKKTKMIEVPDAALDRLASLKAALEKSRMEMEGPKTAMLNLLVGDRGVYNLDKNHHMNVIALDGTIGTLKIRHKMKLALDIEIEKLRAEGVDPLSPDNGRFFVFTRNGMGRDTSFKVSVYKEKIEVAGVGKVERDVVHVLTPELDRRCATEASNLDTLFQVITAEECKQIVDESDLKTGKSPACDRIFDQRWKAEREAKKAANGSQTTAAASVSTPDSDDAPGDDYVEPPAVTVNTVSAVNRPVSVNTTSAVNPPVTVASVVTAPTVTLPAAKVQPVKAQGVEEMSDADFFASINVQA